MKKKNLKTFRFDVIYTAHAFMTIEASNAADAKKVMKEFQEGLTIFDLIIENEEFTIETTPKETK